MRPRSAPNYLAGYPPALAESIIELIETNRLAAILRSKYPAAHGARTDKALYDYVLALKNEFLKNAPQLSKVAYDSTLKVIQQALGTHTTIARIQGGKLKAKREIRIASIFREMPEAFLRMIVVHELAHLKEREHDKAFYQLCRHMEADYHQLELELRAYLAYLAAGGKALWSPAAVDVP
ncbi:M48 family metallopeptidase [Dechloromonas denitrificans]|uniref:M48 metallopeptidase family protein n=1 Tax=Dechloromonas denitrificans TaxID=281362 RepID=UPI001CF88F34|nr:YgjP-like metallopeptidase domain-containing protein [Dechloromonas denitrificans]UCV12700.1 M48 family metallopeptidase [Dechloromonas denitrificans]